MVRAVVCADGSAARSVSLAAHEQAIAPGQGAAFYDEQGRLLGGGQIAA
jgi:tRNA U34 2-thiouridine synthase MnmA/TrmU